MNRETRKELEKIVLGNVKPFPHIGARTILCPFCVHDHDEQGNPIDWLPERSLSITTQENGVLYNCFRAGCKDGRGFISLVDQLIAPPSKKEFTPKQYKYRTVAAQQKYLSKHVALTQEEINRNGIKYSVDRDTYVYPIYDSNGREVGLIDRSYNGRNPKTINYMFNEGQHLAYPKLPLLVLHATRDKCAWKWPAPAIINQSYGVSKRIMLVEDTPSAIVGNRHTRTVSLLGTHLSQERVKELRSKTRNLLIALDPDATQKAIDMAKKYSIFFDSIEVLLFPKDVKDCTDKEIREVLKI